jgi:DNA-binding LacI/PurR family transcriptional regulator
MLDSDPAGSLGAATVNLDITDGIRQVAAHLLDLGHRRFLHLAADVPSWTFEIRARELAAQLDAVPGTSVRTAHAPISIDGALTATEAALATPGPRPTALVCDDDKLAAGAYKAVRRLGLRIPDDISVTGLDDLGLATAIDPELTTVRLDAELFGERGMADARANAKPAVLDHQTIKPGDSIDVDEMLRPRQAERHRRYETLPAGQHAAVIVGVACEQVQRFGDGRGGVILERGGLHRREA